MSKKAAVCIDDWKLPVFKKHLDAAQCNYKVGPGIIGDTLTITVQYEWVAELKPIIEEANKECAALRAATGKENGNG